MGLALELGLLLELLLVEILSPKFFETYFLGEEYLPPKLYCTEYALKQYISKMLDYVKAGRGLEDIGYKTKAGETIRITEREMLHLQDVRAIYQAGMILFACLAGAFVLTAVWLVVRHKYREACMGIVVAAVCIPVLCFALFAWCRFDLSILVIRGHELFFENDLWILDPRKHPMVYLFSRGFYRHAANRFCIREVINLVVTAGFAICFATIAKNKKRA